VCFVLVAYRMGRDSSVGIASWYELEVRELNPDWGEILRSCPDRPLGYQVIPGGKAAGTWLSPPILSSAEVEERVELYLYSFSGPS
jgi:hypothetical protein